MKELAIEGPSLALSRDKAGRIHVAGLEFDPESVGDDTRLVDWILRQREIVVRDMLILSFGFDHRNVDGAEGADFAYTVIDLLRDPDRLLVEMS